MVFMENMRNQVDIPIDTYEINTLARVFRLIRMGGNFPDIAFQ